MQPSDGGKSDARSIEQTNRSVSDGWVPPQPFPGEAGKQATVPVPEPKPGLSSTPDSQAAVTPGQTTGSVAPSDIAPWPVVTPEDVVGRDEKGVLALLGPPDAKWDKPPARVWRYLGDECILAAAFYLDVNDQRFRALSVAAEKIGGGNYAADRCLIRILEKRSAPK